MNYTYHLFNHFIIAEVKCHRLAEQWITKETLKELSPVISKLIHSDDLTRLEFIDYLHVSSMVQLIGKLSFITICVSSLPAFRIEQHNTHIFP